MTNATVTSTTATDRQYPEQARLEKLLTEAQNHLTRCQEAQANRKPSPATLPPTYSRAEYLRRRADNDTIDKQGKQIEALKQMVREQGGVIHDLEKAIRGLEGEVDAQRRVNLDLLMGITWRREHGEEEKEWVEEFLQGLGGMGR